LQFHPIIKFSEVEFSTKREKIEKNGLTFDSLGRRV